MERWRTPVVPVAVETTADEYAHDGSGWRKNVNWTLSPDDYGRLRDGRVCAHCMEPQETPFPDACSLCTFPMREKQEALLAFEFQGEKRVGPSTKLSEELDRLDEFADKRLWVPGQSITVPRTP